MSFRGLFKNTIAVLAAIFMFSAPMVAVGDCGSLGVDLSAQVRTQSVLENYVILKKIDEGAYSHVFLAQHKRLDTLVAIKVLKKKHHSRPDYVEDFADEAKLQPEINHPNVVKLIESDVIRGVHYHVMEYVEGVSLQTLVREFGPLPVHQATRIVADALKGLQAAHALGILHRDIKPANIIVRPDGSASLTDFGISIKAKDQVLDGMAIGTPNYMSPEQCMGELLDHRSDLFAMGTTLYFALTGENPWRGPSPLETMMNIVAIDAHAPITDYRNDLPQKLDQVVDRLLKKEPSQRYPSAQRAALALKPWAG